MTCPAGRFDGWDWWLTTMQVHPPNLLQGEGGVGGPQQKLQS